MTDAGDDLQPPEAPPEGTQPHRADEPHGPDEPHGAGEPHGPDDHATDAGHEHDDHGHMDVPLGPVDWVSWAAGAFGVAIGLVMWFCFAFATS